MIKLWLTDGLGEQMFMLFACLSFSIDTDTEFKIISYAHKNMSDNKTYWTDIFSVFRPQLFHYINTQKSKFQNNNFYDESDETKYIPIILDPSEEYVLTGKFQSYKYFENNIDEIMRYTKIDQKRNRVKEEYSSYFNKKNIVLQFSTKQHIEKQDKFQIIKPEYYVHAIKSIERELQTRGEKIDDYNILYHCCEEDQEYTERYLKVLRCLTQNKFEFIPIDQSIEDWKLLLLISCCSHFIITNTTFSWFSAYLSRNKSSIIYYPSNWFAKETDVSDFIPPHWNKI